MNTEKAIDLLDNLIGMVDDNQENDYDTAFHMAIDALKVQAERTENTRQTSKDELEANGIKIHKDSEEIKDTNMIIKQQAIDSVLTLDVGNRVSWMDAVIDALDALPSFPQITSDTISRQDTIEAMEGVDWYHIDSDGQLTPGANSKDDEPLYKAKDVYTVLNTMPSAQPKERTEERTETHACDLISRQVAIDALVGVTMFKTKHEIMQRVNASVQDEQGWLGAVAECLDEIEDLPSAQPEVLACGEGELIAQPVGTPLHYNGTDYAHGFADGYKQGLKDAHTIEAQQRWIHCSERLPDELAEVNITWINTNPAPYYEFTKGKPNTGSAVYYKGRWYWYSAVCADYLAEYGFSPDDDMDDAIKVIAWMPLPEPYAERRTDERPDQT